MSQIGYKRREKKALKKTLLSRPFNGLVTLVNGLVALDKMALKK
jgi:hypothetical protein